ncbi:hypothetical protein EI546_08605 [Aequorivita sp. H23M31]|uniref:DUF4157 domain-containing protein n=1 Tax=Aequorivita ciconiae TaxID=2494375 RepID=A0A410G3D0_9FLAO|nr:hypothetical protein EI546_08605 [Aequorivita sp. H23M31]
MILLIQPKLLRKNFDGISIWPFVILRHQSLVNDAVFLNHERIHLKQQLELFIIFFYLWYSVEFLFRWIYYRDRYQAYKNISFEREAYFNECNIHYLKSRSIWSFLNYL